MHGLTVNLWLKWSMSLCSCMHSYAGTPIEEPIGIGRSALRPPCYKPWGKRLHDSTASEFQPSDRDWPCLQGEGSFFIVSWQKRQSSLEFFGFLHGRITLFGSFWCTCFVLSVQITTTIIWATLHLTRLQALFSQSHRVRLALTVEATYPGGSPRHELINIHQVDIR